ncbi:hypothetical protein P154DRAFT_219732 [Amniculicola lignicola CBS 123094]|uniref:Uncharacterized protein n=1 Tax=Amniculicola lignicola CBS 123094 TaxID=1392246 RepID=A0A6A5WZH8_9PLEO|nr:hypothetical protein P154DRAFT_219732 [Amniculicola lignicola CBS 123094]
MTSFIRRLLGLSAVDEPPPPIPHRRSHIPISPHSKRKSSISSASGRASKRSRTSSYAPSILPTEEYTSANYYDGVTRGYSADHGFATLDELRERERERVAAEGGGEAKRKGWEAEGVQWENVAATGRGSTATITGRAVGRKESVEQGERRRSSEGRKSSERKVSIGRRAASTRPRSRSMEETGRHPIGRSPTWVWPKKMGGFRNMEDVEEIDDTSSSETSLASSLENEGQELGSGSGSGDVLDLPIHIGSTTSESSTSSESVVVPPESSDKMPEELYFRQLELQSKVINSEWKREREDETLFEKEGPAEETESDDKPNAIARNILRDALKEDVRDIATIREWIIESFPEPIYAFKDVEIRDGMWANMDRIQLLVKEFFTWEHQGGNATLRRAFQSMEPETVRVIGCIASGGPGAQEGWRRLFKVGVQRRALVAGIIGNVLVEQVYQHALFGGTKEQLRDLQRIQIKEADRDGKSSRVYRTLYTFLIDPY